MSRGDTTKLFYTSKRKKRFTLSSGTLKSEKGLSFESLIPVLAKEQTRSVVPKLYMSYN